MSPTVIIARDLRDAETIPQLEALIALQKAKIEKFTQEHAA